MYLKPASHSGWETLAVIPHSKTLAELGSAAYVHIKPGR